MKKLIACTIALAFVLPACGGEDIEDASVETRHTVSALLNAQGGPVQEGEEGFTVEVSYGGDVTEEDARELLTNIRVRQAQPGLRARPEIQNEGALYPVNTHWFLPEDHEVSVVVIPENQENVDDREWEWIDVAITAPHCPEGHDFHL